MSRCKVPVTLPDGRRVWLIGSTLQEAFTKGLMKYGNIAREQPEKPAPGRRRRGPRNEGPKEPKQEIRQEKFKQKTALPVEDNTQERSEKKPFRRRPNYRRRKPKSPSGGQENT